MNKYSTSLAIFAQAPAMSIDQELTVKLKVLSEQKDDVKSDQVLEILDLGARYSMMSEFAMRALDELWYIMIKDEGKTEEQARLEAEPRRKAHEASE